MTTEHTSTDQADQPLGVGSHAGLGLAPERDLVERLRLQWPDTPHHRDALHREAADEIERLRAAVAAKRERRATLPRLPTPRLLASGTIAGKRVELHGWHTEDIEIWERQHGLKFRA